MMGPKKAVYDAEINPLMVQIINICKRERMSLLCDFGLDGNMHSTSALLMEAHNPSEAQLQSLRLLMKG